MSISGLPCTQICSPFAQCRYTRTTARRVAKPRTAITTASSKTTPIHRVSSPTSASTSWVTATGGTTAASAVAARRGTATGSCWRTCPPWPTARTPPSRPAWPANGSSSSAPCRSSWPPTACAWSSPSPRQREPPRQAHLERSSWDLPSSSVILLFIRGTRDGRFNCRFILYYSHLVCTHLVSCVTAHSSCGCATLIPMLPRLYIIFEFAPVLLLLLRMCRLFHSLSRCKMEIN